MTVGAAALCAACVGNRTRSDRVESESESDFEFESGSGSESESESEVESESESESEVESEVLDACATCALPFVCVQSTCQLPIRATFAAERIGPNADWSGLEAPAYVPLATMDVVLAGDSAVLARATTDPAGHVELMAPWPLPADAALVVSAVLADADRPVVAILDGQAIPFPAGNGTPVQAARVWTWRFALAIDGASETAGALGELRIPQAAGSGALALLATLAEARAYALDRFLPTPQARAALPTIAVLWSPAYAPPCLSCYFPRGTAPVDLPDGTRFDVALFVAGTAPNALHWTPSLTAHEVGHWVLDAFSRMPSAGGSHSWVTAAWPPLGWSEGFATFFAQRALGQARFFTMQNGTQYWIDIDRIGGPVSEASSLAMPFPLPDPDGPLAQPIGEAAVAAILYDLADALGAGGAPDDDLVALGDEALTGIAAPRLASGAIERGAPDGPDLVDYLDGLVCEGIATRSELMPALLGLPYDDGVCEP